MGLAKGFFDYCPVLLLDKKNWGPTFKFFNAWLRFPGFKKFVEDKWNGYDIQGWGVMC